MKNMLLIPFDAHSNHFEFEVPFMGSTTKPAEEMALGTVVLGTSGSGKSVSAIIPVLRSLIRYKNENGDMAGIIYIDWKCEGLENTRQYLDSSGQGLRLLETRKLPKPFWFFEFCHDQCLQEKVNLLAVISGLKTRARGDSAIWVDKAIWLFLKICELEVLLKAVLSQKVNEYPALVYVLKNKSALGVLIDLAINLPDGSSYVQDVDFGKAILRHACSREGVVDIVTFDRNSGSDQSAYPQEAILRHICNRLGKNDCPTDASSIQCGFFESCDLLLDLISNGTSFRKQVSALHGILLSLLGSSRIHKIPFASRLVSEECHQFMYRSSILKTMLQDFGSEETRRFVNFDPTISSSESSHTSLQSLLDSGAVVLHQPSNKGLESDQRCCEVLRTMMIQYLKRRSDPMKVTGYICDEFNNYMSTNRDFGEVGLASWGRAFRCIAAYATQSTAALEVRVQELGDSSGEQALQALLTNLPNKIVFKSNEATTQKWAEHTVGRDGGILNLNTLVTRNLPSLSVGEYHFLSSSGVKGMQKAFTENTVYRLLNGIPISHSEATSLNRECCRA